MLYFYTENFFISKRIKNFFKGILGFKIRGPEEVFRSLKDGLNSLGVDFIVNQRIVTSVDTACVLSGADVLNWAIGQKKKGLIKKLVAGPNVVTTLLDFGRLIQDPNIDMIVSPSDWVVKWWLSLAPGLERKLKVWAAGVSESALFSQAGEKVVVFVKDKESKLSNEIIGSLQAKNLPMEKIVYGNFSYDQYATLLSQAKVLIYIGKSESQGLALLQAWMANVPTLVYNPRFMRYKNFKWQDEKIAAPYLNSHVGEFFSNSEDFEEIFSSFLKNSKNFQPRRYVMENFTDEICAKKFIDLIYEKN